MGKRRKKARLASVEFRAKTRKETELEYKRWRADYRHKYRLIKKHQAKRLPNNGLAIPRRDQKMAHKYSILVEYEELTGSSDLT
jgi:hypothetical protein